MLTLKIESLYRGIIWLNVDSAIIPDLINMPVVFSVIDVGASRQGNVVPFDFDMAKMKFKAISVYHNNSMVGGVRAKDKSCAEFEYVGMQDSISKF